MSNRKAAEEFILKYVDKLLPGSDNVKLYKSLFSSMSDDDFKQYMDDIDTGRKFIAVVCPNFTEPALSGDRNYAIADELGHNFFQRIWIEGTGDVPTYLTPIPYLVLDLPLKRASQLLIKKISVPDNNRVVDTLTGQPTGESKGASISTPELQVCAAMGLESTMVELLKYRGGDVKGFQAMNNMIAKYGSANLKTLSMYASGVESTNTLKTFLTAMHVKSTL
jgi:hypothetical protein